ncbi:MAG: double zinc ribbon domain-containing protein [Dorea sp.]
MNIWRNIKKNLWPEICPFCGKIHKYGICPDCRKKIEKLRVVEPRCMKCGKPVRYKEQEYCHDCMHTRHFFDRGLSAWLHKEPVNLSIYQFKYNNQREFARYYAQEIWNRYQDIIRSWAVEFIIPVPLHKKRRRNRGYNQSAILAKELGRLLKIPVGEKAVRRIRYTDPQKKLDHRKRKANLEHAFRMGKIPENVKKVLLIDDIYTTGNTIDAVSCELKKSGVEKVYFLTISIGQGY